MLRMLKLRFHRMLCFHLLGQTPDPFVRQLVTRSATGILTLFWQIQGEQCNWLIRVVTTNYTLYPADQVPADVPIELNSEYNVTENYNEVPCDPERGLEVNVTLSILLNDNVLENVPYVVCKISRRVSSNNMIELHRSKEVYLLEPDDDKTTTLNDENVTTLIPSETVSVGTDCVTCAGCRPLHQVLQLCTFLCLIFSFLYTVL